MAGTFSLSLSLEQERQSAVLDDKQSCSRQYDFDSHRTTVPDEWDEPTQRSVDIDVTKSWSPEITYFSEVFVD